MIKNGIKGITLDSPSNTAEPKLLLANSVVKNMQIAGFLGYHTNLAAYNNLFFNCGQYLIYAVGGGDYDFVQNTFAAYNFNFARRTSALYFTDYTGENQFEMLQVNFTNNIVWGSLDDEISVDTKSDFTPNITFNYNLLKSLNNFGGTGNLYNNDPLFVSPRLGNLKLTEGSPATDKGTDLSSHSYFSTYLKRDMLDTIRQFPSEMGCYEQQ